MEEDEQAQPEGETEEVEPPRCRRHPSQLLTGICPSCLMERLSSVRDRPEAEIVEVGPAEPGEGSGADPSKLRKTLMLLFQLDDSSGGSDVAHPSKGKGPPVAELEVDSGAGGDRGGKWKGGSWLRSIFPRRGMRWRRNGGSWKEPSVDPNGGGGDAQVERKPSFRRSCEWRVCREPSRGSLEPPRHSWDGSMVGRAFPCSFACLEEPPDEVRRARQNNAEEAVGETRVVVAESRNGGHSADVGSEGRRFSGRSCNDTGLEMTVSGVRRRRSNRWSRVWDRSITSPLKEFVRKGEHVLERSLSESRKEIRRGKNAEAADINGEIQSGRNGHGLSRASQCAIRSSQAASNGDAQNFRADWLKNKECKIGRSRSVHYTSPGNLDNGMLRFYLTPMRSTRTVNRGRRRNSRLFARGLFGFI
ncbi:uncharacterized protein LOC133911593 [Phragmites australis]|uniref:uncharacterized protein LOC133911593 n=1 Tax=Phragmites australis TaxID=29695 RepID=UPI002D7940D2|nr:uncharacterized protein LOC133911593 [Phragmites australis]XP_062209886.1 uncharacterized protein LOC133911593 [Phragmites australis]XP_062209887.1 uncharacterized protein LOC133911593 [Phragmites australis]XP_062209888.1 uncharacterized protein LOC133911593 [Phragmites australis]XP_062209889.1 uncharacterized protein LOC133911593 [Phragmites australis]